MNYFDLFVLVVAAFALIRGFQKGFVLELASLVGLILGVVGAIYLSGVTSEWLANFITSRYVAIMAFILILVGIILLVHLLAKMVDSTVKAMALGWLNRVVGGFFAVVKAAFGISLLIFVLEFSGYGARVIPSETRSDSRTFEPLEWLAPATFGFLQINYQHLLAPKQRENSIPAPVII